jgi:hypothetical protein
VVFINPKSLGRHSRRKPYPLKAGLRAAATLNAANAREAYAALKKLEFLVVIDFPLPPRQS